MENIEKFVRTGLPETWNVKLADWFSVYKQDRLEGKFDELQDTGLHQWFGRDSNGLSTSTGSKYGICKFAAGWNTFPKHVKVDFFQKVENFVSVGIGPLTYNAEYVELCDTPNEDLSENMKLTAKKKGVKEPPTNVSTRRENKICNDAFKAKQGSFTIADVRSLSASF